MQNALLVVSDACYDTTTLIGYICITYIMYLTAIAARLSIDMNASESVRAGDRNFFVAIAAVLAFVMIGVNVARPLTDKYAWSMISYITLCVYMLIVIGKGWHCIRQVQCERVWCIV